MKNNKGKVELFTTNVGSHMWSMNTPDSDLDLFVCYLAPSKDFLLGKTHRGGHHSIVNGNDRTSYELGHVVDMIAKNNFNFLTGVMSPIIIKDWVSEPLSKEKMNELLSKSVRMRKRRTAKRRVNLNASANYLRNGERKSELKTLRLLIMLNISKLCYDSIHGSAVHNYNKYILSGRDNTEKNRKSIVRTLKFGICLLKDAAFRFEPVKEQVTEEHIIHYIQELDWTYEKSPLPDKPKHLEELYNWLLQIRLKNLEDEL